jgi:putative FmdB family regulatory protein
MPLYEYECKSCGILEIQQKISDAAIKNCPYCQSEIAKVLSVVSAPIFKGSGFYQTDYKSKKKSPDD